MKNSGIIFSIAAWLILFITLGFFVIGYFQLKTQLANIAIITSTTIPPMLPEIDSTVSVINIKIDSLNVANQKATDRQIRYLKGLINKTQQVRKVDVSTPAGIDSLISNLNNL